MSVATVGTERDHGRRCEKCRVPLDRPTRRGRLMLLDLIVLVAATGLALGIARASSTDFASLPTSFKVLIVSVSLLITWTPSALYLRLRLPRPSLRRLSRQPGFAASLAATAVLAVGGLGIVILEIARIARASGMRLGTRSMNSAPHWSFGALSQLTIYVGAAVLGAWVLLVLSGRRRPEPGALDALGRLIGSLWIAWFAIRLVMEMWRVSH